MISTVDSILNKDSTIWCAGLPYLEDRQLSDADRAELNNRLLKIDSAIRIYWIVLVVAAIAVPISGVKLASLLKREDTANGDFALLLVAVCSVLMATIIVCSIGISRFIRMKSGYGSDIVNGTITLYSGILTERSPLERTQINLLSSRLLTLDANRTQTIEVLKSTNLIWRVNGHLFFRSLRPKLTEVANTPGFAAIAAEWLEPLGKHETSILYGGRRELSANEKNELKRFVSRLMRRPATSCLPVGFLSIAMAAGQYSGFKSDKDPTFWFYLMGGITNFGLYLFQIKQASKFWDDLKVGYVGIRRIGSADDAAVKSAPVEPDIEFLPVTGRLWTKSGEPAVWRRGSI